MYFSDLVAALFTAGLPLFVLSFGLISWALHRGRLHGETVRELQDGIKVLRKTQKDKKTREKIDPALDKWLRFGGGFYGLVALYTWLLVEWDELIGFLWGLGDMVLNLDPGALIGLLIKLFIESIMNFVVAIGWPAYWLKSMNEPWLLLAAAYGGYWSGMKAAQHAARDARFRGAIDRGLALLRRDGRQSQED